MDITVTLKVTIDVDGWQAEYGHTSAANALVEALNDLREPGWYLTGAKWKDLAEVKERQGRLQSLI